jgi:acetyltransferase-like isoleucine patch superfamily enzyme
VKNPILRWAQRQMGTGRLDYVSVRSMLSGIVGRVVQYVAMTSFPMVPSFRVWLQRLRGVRIGRGVFIGPRVYLDPVRPDLITVEELVSLAGFVTILTHSEPTEPLRAILGEAGNKIAPVTIKRGAWVAIHCAILPGVTIGECAIIAAGSVVSRDVAPYTMVGGVPARFIKRLGRATAESKPLSGLQNDVVEKGE